MLRLSTTFSTDSVENAEGRHPCSTESMMLHDTTIRSLSMAEPADSLIDESSNDFRGLVRLGVPVWR